MIAELDERGVPVVFVTGRPLRWAEEVFQYVGAHGLAVVSNGALVWDVARNEVDLVREIPVDVGLEVCRLIREAVPGATFAVETLAGIALESVFLERHPIPEGSRRGDLEDVFDAPALKILARHEELPAQEFWDLALAAVADRAVITWSSTSALLEISAAGVTKASTLALLCDRLGVGARRRRRVRRHAERPADARVGGPVLGDGRRPPDGARRGRPRGPRPRRRRRGDGAGWPLRPVIC